MKRFLSLACSLALMFACSDKQHAGGVTDIGNSVAGIVVDSSGTPVKGARVYLSSYQLKDDATSSLDTQGVTADSLGHFHFDHVALGAWVLHGISANGTAALQQFEMKANGVDSETLALNSLSVLRGRILDTTGILRAFIPGSGNLPIAISAQGFYRLDSVPRGDFRLCISNGSAVWCVSIQTNRGADTLDLVDLHTQTDSTLAPINYAVDSLPSYYLGKDFSHVKFGKGTQDTAKALVAGWTYSDSIRISWQGSEPSQTLLGFPLAVKLTSASIDFSHFQNSGADVRIMDTANHLLSYEIEQWDSANGKALLWVHLDSVPKLTSSARLWIVGGNKLANTQATVTPVFSSANGYAAVYHFAESALDSGTTVHDATPLLRNGTMAQKSFGRMGALGAGLEFNGDSNRVELGSWDPCAGDFSVSLWVNWKGPNGQHQIIMAKRNSWDSSQTRWQWHYDYLNQSFASYQIAFEAPKFTNANVPKNTWSFLTLAYSATTDSIRMWVDGAPVDSGHIFVPGVAVTSYLRLGGSDAGESWNGAMDEVRIEDVVRSEDWIRLSHVTQAKAAGL